MEKNGEAYLFMFFFFFKMSNNHHQEKKNSTEQEIKIDVMQNIHEDDKFLVENIINALESLGSRDMPLCRKYKILTISTGYHLIAKLPSTDIFNLQLEDLLFLQSVSPTRIESISIGRNANHPSVELSIKILNNEQKIMITSSLSFHTTRKRKLEHIP